jgi:hypothetical protein
VALGASWRAWRRGGDDGAGWLLSFGLVPILFFLPLSLVTREDLSRVQWDLVGYAVGIVALAGWIAGSPGKGSRNPEERFLEPFPARRGLGLAAVGTALLTTSLLVLGALRPDLAVAVGLRPPTQRMLGWRELAAAIREAEQGSWTRPPFLLTESFDAALCLGFERGSREGIYTFRGAHDRRYGLTGQLEAWGIDEARAFKDRRGQEAIYVQEFLHPDRPQAEKVPRRLFRRFREVTLLREVEVVVGTRVVRRFGLYRAVPKLLL